MALPVRLVALGEALMRPLQRVQEQLWTRAVAEQKRLTIQLCRNSLYFMLSGILIRFFGDQLAV